MHDERRAEGSEEIELVAFAAQGDPLAAGSEWLHDELDLAGLPVDAIEGVRPPKERLERRPGTHVDELAGARLRGDPRRGDPQDRPERPEAHRTAF